MLKRWGVRVSKACYKFQVEAKTCFHLKIALNMQRGATSISEDGNAPVSPSFLSDPMAACSLILLKMSLSLIFILVVLGKVYIGPVDYLVGQIFGR